MSKRDNKKNSLNQKRAFNKKKLKSAIITVLYKDPSKVFNHKQISSLLGVDNIEVKKLIPIALEELKEDGYLETISRGKYRLLTRSNIIYGIIELQPQGFGHLISDEADSPILISAKNLNKALDGDRVKVELYARRKRGDQEGEVIEIVERANRQFVGSIDLIGHYAFLVPSGKIGFDIFIAKEHLNGAVNGQKAIAEIIEWPPKARNPFGRIIEVLGDAGDNETEMNAILAEFDLPHKFPKKISSVAEKISSKIPQSEIKKRRDFRDINTFTIDPEDAKDFDDALSLRRVNNLWEVGIHIADVTHYVTPDSLIEEEAQNRATSVYLVDRVVPMLPERLSNDICSLKPNEERLCFSALFEMNDEAQIVNRWFGKSIIRSNHKFSYKEAQEIIETGNGNFSFEVLKLNDLAQKLRKLRFEKGSVDFERDEIKFELDEKGKPIDIMVKKSSEANRLIEEFMLLANKEVAELIGKTTGRKRSKTFIYRIHDKPDPEKLELFNNFINRFGYNIKFYSPKAVSNSMNQLLKEIKHRKEKNVIESLAIRTMAKAMYSTRNIGHYGLSFSYYTHFTSPIRRYPDMMVHRLLERYLNGGKSVNKIRYEELCKHSTDMEIRASNAERASIKYKQVEFMQEHINKIFKGVISGVTQWGIYVELDNHVEGMVPVRELDDDFYIFDEQNFALIGRHNHKKYQLGDEVIIKIWRTNLEKKQLDFKLVNRQKN